MAALNTFSNAIAVTRLLRVVTRVESLPTALRILREAPEYIDLTPSQYERAAEWARSHDLLDDSGLPLGPTDEIVLRGLTLVLTSAPPAWLGAAPSILSSADLPTEFAETCDLAGISGELALQAIGAAYGKFDDERRREVGALGESLLLRELTARATGRVVHVASFDDSAGYDIAILSSPPARVEVKTTTRRAANVHVYLSRNELRAMVGLPGWCMQLVLLDGGVASFGYVQADVIESRTPVDRRAGRWESCRLSLETSEIEEGAHPRLLAALSDPLPKAVDVD